MVGFLVGLCVVGYCANRACRVASSGLRISRHWAFAIASSKASHNSLAWACNSLATRPV
ncbi:hypothetical protein Paride_0403 [Pseudomonas phage Paride]|nr:hypothetical protein Paride_0403 [Pseudomonas phage Paride]